MEFLLYLALGACAGVLAGLFLTLIARPLSVWACAAWFKVPWRQQAFLSWAGLRGAVPIIMATVPLASSLRLQAYRYDMKGLVLSPFGSASFAGVWREMSEVKKP